MTVTESMHSLSNLKDIGIFDYIEDRVINYDKKNPSNLCKNCLVSKRYIISKEIVMENYNDA